jgi:hypothetical protein
MITKACTVFFVLPKVRYVGYDILINTTLQGTAAAVAGIHCHDGWLNGLGHW